MAKSSDSSNYLGQLEDMLEEYLVKKAPALPENAKEILVKFIPWINLIFIILGLPILLALFGLSAVFTPFAMMGGYQGSAFSIIFQILTLVTIVVEIMALPGLFKRQAQGWRLSFYATLISLVTGLFGGNLVSAIVGAIISLYLLFQIKSYYK
jgi:hypothetical protein